MMNKENRNEKINAMNKLISFNFNFDWKKGTETDIFYPNFILDIWNDDKDFFLEKFQRFDYSLVRFYCELDNNNKIKLLSYILDNYNSEVPLKNL